MVTKPSESDVLVGYQGDPVSTGDLTSSEVDSLIDEAVNMFEGVFDDRILFTGETLNENDAIKYLARHKIAIALGDTVQSESQGGANTSYNIPTSTARSLGRTEYGQEFLEYMRDEPNIGVYRTR